MTPRLPALSHAYRPQPRSDSPAHPAESRRPFVVATLFTALMAALLAATWAASPATYDLAIAAVEAVRAGDSVIARAAASVVLVAAAALAYVVAWSRATAPGRPVRVPGGRGTIAVHELGAWLRDAVEARPDVRTADVAVRSQGKGVRVAARIAVTADARLQDTTAGARSLIEQTLATQIGVPLAAEPTIELRYEELRLRPRSDERRDGRLLEALTDADA